MLYKQTKFTVPAVGDRDPAECARVGHGWLNKGRCIFCGELVVVIKTEDPNVVQECAEEDRGEGRSLERGGRSDSGEEQSQRLAGGEAEEP